MKQNRKWIFQITMIIALFSGLPFLALAQGPCPSCPIDGGLSFLIAAGVGYGIKKVRDNRKKSQIEDSIK